jgi:peptide/nickel transport system ATP-binding protein
MALSCNPLLLIADEPTTAVDVTTQAQVLRLLRNLQQQRNAAIIFITHDLGVIAQMADYVTVMYLGLVVEQAPVDDIFHNSKHPYTQALLESIPTVNMTPRMNLPTISGAIPHPFNKPKGCPFHPRCSKAIPGKCNLHIPKLNPISEKQAVSCFLYHEEEAA